MTNWKKEMNQALKKRKETWNDVEQCTLSKGDLVKEFDGGYGHECGTPFTVWTKNTVYFPICYDGSEWCGNVARNPDGQPTPHQGGG